MAEEIRPDLIRPVGASMVEEVKEIVNAFAQSSELF